MAKRVRIEISSGAIFQWPPFRNGKLKAIEWRCPSTKSILQVFIAAFFNFLPCDNIKYNIIRINMSSCRPISASICSATLASHRHNIKKTKHTELSAAAFLRRVALEYSLLRLCQIPSNSIKIEA